MGKSANDIPIETFFVPDDPSWQESYGANGELDVPLGWATQSLSAYSGEDGPYEVIRAPEKLSNAHGGDDGPAADTAPKTTPSMALYDGVGRLAHCVEGLSSRLERIEHEALSTRGGRHEAYRQGHVHDRDSELDFLRDTVTDLERRLVTVQSSFQDTMQSMTTQLMLFQQRLAAVETTQVRTFSAVNVDLCNSILRTRFSDEMGRNAANFPLDSPCDDTPQSDRQRDGERPDSLRLRQP